MKRIVAVTFAMLLLYVVANGETTPTAPTKKPVISDLTKEAFWKAKANFQDASLAAKQANDNVDKAKAILQKSIEALQMECGENNVPEMLGDDVGCGERDKVMTQEPKQQKK